MARLSITLKLHDAVFDARVVALRDGLRLEEAAGVASSFGEADGVIHRTPTGWRLGNEALVPGVPMRHTEGDITTVLEWLDEAHVPWLHRPGPDLVPFMLTAALVLWATAHDTVMSVFRADPGLADEVAAMFLPGLNATHDVSTHAPTVDAWPPAVGYLDVDTDAP